MAETLLNEGMVGVLKYLTAQTDLKNRQVTDEEAERLQVACKGGYVRMWFKPPKFGTALDVRYAIDTAHYTPLQRLVSRVVSRHIAEEIIGPPRTRIWLKRSR